MLSFTSASLLQYLHFNRTAQIVDPKLVGGEEQRCNPPPEGEREAAAGPTDLQENFTPDLAFLC